MDRDGLLISERIREISAMCAREQPIYEQISNYSVALYVFGYFGNSGLMDCDEVDDIEAGLFLKENFKRIDKEDVPKDYDIFESEERYLLVIGDPLFPTHFAVIVNMQNDRPFFSKLEFFGSGFDALDELEKEFVGRDGIGSGDFSYYKMNDRKPVKKNDSARIYTIRDDGNVTVFEYQSAAR